jgi:hypothetical protein
MGYAETVEARRSGETGGEGAPSGAAATGAAGGFGRSWSPRQHAVKEAARTHG